MYQTTNYLEKRRNGTSSLPRISSAAPKWSNPFVITQPSPNIPPIPRCQTNPYHGMANDIADIHISYSEGYHVKHSIKEQKAAMSGARAADLMTQYEMADDDEKQQSLVRKADFTRMNIPSLGAGLGSGQSLLAQAQRKKKEANGKENSLRPAEVSGTHGFRKAAVLISEVESSGNIADTLTQPESFEGETKCPLPSSTSRGPMHEAAFTQQRQLRKPSYQDTAGKVMLQSKGGQCPTSQVPSVSQLISRSFDEPKHTKKTGAQQRIDKARETRMRMVAEIATNADNELPTEVGMDLVSEPHGVCAVESTGREAPVKTSYASAPFPDKWQSNQDGHLLC